MRSGHVSHRWTSFCNYHFDHGIIVFKDVQLRLGLKRICVLVYIIHVIQLLNYLPSFDILRLGFGMESRTNFLDTVMVVLDSVVG